MRDNASVCAHQSYTATAIAEMESVVCSCSCRPLPLVTDTTYPRYPCARRGVVTDVDGHYRLIVCLRYCVSRCSLLCLLVVVVALALLCAPVTTVHRRAGGFNLYQNLQLDHNCRFASDSKTGLSCNVSHTPANSSGAETQFSARLRRKPCNNCCGDISRQVHSVAWRPKMRRLAACFAALPRVAQFVAALFSADSCAVDGFTSLFAPVCPRLTLESLAITQNGKVCTRLAG